MILRRAFIAALAGACVSVALAPAAGADPARPGNYASRVLCIVAAPESVETTATCADATAVPVTAKVVGGDGFLDLTVQRGTTVEIPGYTGEPWLRVESNGTVLENQASSATYLNETRYGTAGNVEIPSWVTIGRATEHPMWKVVGHDGNYIWHDHRIHYMNPHVPPKTVPGTDRVVISDRDDGLWYIPMVIDGVPHLILGELRVFPAPNPLPQWGLMIGLFALASAIGFALRGPAARIAAGALVVTGSLTLWAGAAELRVIPKLAGANPIWVGLPIATILLGVVALVARSAAARSIAVLAGAATLGVWGVLRIPALATAVPLGDLDPTLTRFVIAGAVGVAAGSAVAAIASGGLSLRLAELDDDHEPDPEAGTAASDEPERPDR